jgi:sn-glycerol 3-phosphate transport system ATP-binding protein
VTHVEEMGNLRLVHGQHAGQPITVALPADQPSGERMRLQALPGRLHLFDHVTGRRLAEGTSVPRP